MVKPAGMNQSQTCNVFINPEMVLNKLLKKGIILPDYGSEIWLLISDLSCYLVDETLDKQRIIVAVALYHWFFTHIHAVMYSISVRNKPGFGKFTMFSQTKPIFTDSKFTNYGKQAIKFYINIT